MALILNRFSATRAAFTIRHLAEFSTLMKIRFALVALLLTIDSHSQDFPVTSLSIGVHLIRAEVATSEDERARGLMFRQRLAPNEGMVFRFPEPRQVCMWMKNTLLPLSVAFIGGDGKIINIEDMKPQTLDPHCGKKPARYALEMSQGWFRERNIHPGTPVSGLPK
jgi:uncharacterized membrane protein (UPF0127 family)